MSIKAYTFEAEPHAGSQTTSAGDFITVSEQNTTQTSAGQRNTRQYNAFEEISHDYEDSPDVRPPKEAVPVKIQPKRNWLLLALLLFMGFVLLVGRN